MGEFSFVERFARRQAGSPVGADAPYGQNEKERTKGSPPRERGGGNLCSERTGRHLLAIFRRSRLQRVRVRRDGSRRRRSCPAWAEKPRRSDRIVRRGSR